MTIPNRYECTLRQDCCDPVSCTVYAYTVKEARAKAHARWIQGLPFWTWTLSNISVSRLGSAK